MNVNIILAIIVSIGIGIISYIVFDEINSMNRLIHL